MTFWATGAAGAYIHAKLIRTISDTLHGRGSRLVSQYSRSLCWRSRAGSPRASHGILSAAPLRRHCQYRALQMCCTDSVLLGICPFPADSSAAPAFTETSGMFGLVRPVEVCKVLEQTDRHRLLSRRTRGSFVRRSSRRSALQVGSRPFGRRLRHCKVTRRFSFSW